MKIAMTGSFVNIPPLHGGAIEAIMFSLSSEMTKRGNEVHLFIGGEKDGTKVIDEISIHYFSARSLPLAPSVSREYFLGKRIGRAIGQGNFDVVHGQGFIPTYSYLASLKKRGIPLVFTEHLPYIWLPRWRELSFKRKLFRPVQQQFSRTLYQKADRLIFLSENLRNEIGQKTELDENRISIIPNAVDSEVYNPRNRDTSIFKKWGLDNGKPKLLFVGRLYPEKGIRYLLRAMELVLQKYDADLIIVGSSLGEGKGPEEDYLKNLVGELGISNNVVFTGRGYIEDVKKLYASADIFCLPSLYEAFPVVILEAIASKICILSTTVAAIPEAIENGKDGLLVPPRDPEALAEGLLRLLEDKRLREELRENAYRKVKEKYSWPRVTEQTLAVYKEVIEGWRRRV